MTTERVLECRIRSEGTADGLFAGHQIRHLEDSRLKIETNLIIDIGELVDEGIEFLRQRLEDRLPRGERRLVRRVIATCNGWLSYTAPV